MENKQCQLEKEWGFISCGIILSSVGCKSSYISFKSYKISLLYQTTLWLFVIKVTRLQEGFFIKSLCHHINKYQWAVQYAVQSAHPLPLYAGLISSKPWHDWSPTAGPKCCMCFGFCSQCSSTWFKRVFKWLIVKYKRFVLVSTGWLV